MVRAISMQPTDGLVRGAEVRDTGDSITVPVGDVTKSHVWNTLGKPLDVPEASLEIKERWGIHRPAPTFDQLESKTEVFWTGFTDQPTYEDAKNIAAAVFEAFNTPTAEGGVDEIHMVYTHFVNMAVQQVRVRRILPVEILEVSKEQASEKLDTKVFPLYDFEPSPEAVLEALLPRYVENMIYTALLLAAASEHAARRRAMKSASDNAEELIRTLARQANQARQAEITQEISEIVGGADALASA